MIFLAFRCAYCLFYNESRKTKLSVPKLNNPNELGKPSVNNNNNNNSILNNNNIKASKRMPLLASNNNDDDSLIDTGSYLSTLVNKKSKEIINENGQGDAIDGGNSEANPSTTLSSSNSLDDIASLSEPISNEPVGSIKNTKSD